MKRVQHLRNRLFRGCAMALLAAVLLLTGPMAPAAEAVSQADIDALKGDVTALSKQREELQAKLNDLKDDKSAAVEKKNLLDQQAANLQSQINNIQSQISTYAALITQTEAELADAEQREAEQYELFCTRVRAMEERGTVSYWSVLFHSASFSDLLSAMDFISEIMESDQRVIDELRELRAQIEAEKASLETALAEQESAKAALVTKNTELKQQQTAAEALVNELKANETEYQKLVAAMEAEMEKQQEEIIRLSRELAIQNGDTTETYGGYIWPCSSHYVTAPLGARYTGIPGASTNHAGIDIGRVYYSTQVVAAKAGTVIISAYNKYRGNYVVISHGSGNTTTYQHLSKRSVEVGQYVAQGQVVGITGSTGVSSGPHLHFEISEGGKIVNPLAYLTDYIKGW